MNTSIARPEQFSESENAGISPECASLRVKYGWMRERLRRPNSGSCRRQEWTLVRRGIALEQRGDSRFRICVVNRKSRGAGVAGRVCSVHTTQG